VADDNAISDTMYFLAKALNSERIDLAVFMKVNNATKKKRKKTIIHSFIFVFITKVHTHTGKRTVYEESFGKENHRNEVAIINYYV
jgi:hypothetical protein